MLLCTALSRRLSPSGLSPQSSSAMLSCDGSRETRCAPEKSRRRLRHLSEFLPSSALEQLGIRLRSLCPTFPLSKQLDEELPLLQLLLLLPLLPSSPGPSPTAEGIRKRSSDDLRVMNARFDTVRLSSCWTELRLRFGSSRERGREMIVRFLSK